MSGVLHIFQMEPFPADVGGGADTLYVLLARQQGHLSRMQAQMDRQKTNAALLCAINRCQARQ